MEECLIFQKLSSQEQVIISALDHLVSIQDLEEDTEEDTVVDELEDDV